MAIIGDLARIERGGAYTMGNVQNRREAINEVTETLDLRYIVVPEWHKTSRAHAYLLDVFEGCLEILVDDRLKRAYPVQRPCR